MPVEVGHQVLHAASGKHGRLIALTEAQATVLVAYQAGAVEVTEAFAPDSLTTIDE